jgi:hypothetical protein
VKQKYRIHGDNIIECEVAIGIITDAIKFTTGSDYSVKLIESISVTPAYEVSFENGLEFILEFFPGHNRWNVSLPDFLTQLGSPLRESVDAFVTLLNEDTEVPLAAFEFCNALPAGNNAWQRAGRALSMTSANIPYFYFAEIGGQELDANREIKAPRFPNPIVPFSYLSMSSATPDKCTTIYMPSRSISKDTYEEFKDAFADNDYKNAISALFTGNEISEEFLKNSKIKSSQFVYDLAEKRKRSNTHSLETWQKLLNSAKLGKPLAGHLLSDNLKWTKKISIESNPSLPKLIALLKLLEVSAIGSVDMPFCVIDTSKKAKLAEELSKLYGETLSNEFVDWLKNSDKDLVVVFIAGFKPRGDDSRPDRGLVPLARMIFANDDVNVISVVYGPAKAITWSRLFEDPYMLSANNGLWEAIVNLSNAILVDSKTLPVGQRRDVLIKAQASKVEDTSLARFSNIPRFGEHDVDSVLHLIFSNSEDNGVFESLCNPPGGDWSGVSFLDSEGSTNRWTSLPRVTGIEGKRPDHIIQYFDTNRVVLSIESKDLLRNLEEGVGPRLDHYTKELLVNGMAQSKKLKDSLEWSQEINLEVLKQAVSEYDFLSAVAIMGNEAEARESLSKSQSNAAFAISFVEDGSTELIFISNHPKLREMIINFLNTQQNKLKLLNINLRSIN